MKEKLRRATNFTKSALFSIIIHGVLITALLASLWWPFSETNIKRGSVKPIQAQAISAEEIQKQIDRKQQQETEKKQEAQRKLDEIKKKQEDEKKKLEALEQKRVAEEARIEDEKQKKITQEKQQKKDAEKRKAEEEQNRIEAQKKKKQAEEQKAAEEKKRKEAEAKRKREEELRKQLESEQRVRTQSEAESALGRLVDRIATAVENQWRPPLNYSGGLEVVIQVKVSRNGDVLSANVVKSSGDHFFDRSAEVATQKASPLPFPSEQKYYEFIKVFNIKFIPSDF